MDLAALGAHSLVRPLQACTVHNIYYAIGDEGILRVAFVCSVYFHNGGRGCKAVRLFGWVVFIHDDGLLRNNGLLASCQLGKEHRLRDRHYRWKYIAAKWLNRCSRYVRCQKWKQVLIHLEIVDVFVLGLLQFLFPLILSFLDNDLYYRSFYCGY